MLDWVRGLSVASVIGLVLAVLVVLAVAAAWLTRALVRRGRRTPWVVGRVNRAVEQLIELIRRPLTIVVLDEVADVIQTGRYTQNISDALQENRAELKALVADKVRADPNVRFVSRIPLYDAVVDHVSETTLRVIVEMLDDPRMEELVSDVLRNNLVQIKKAVRERQHEQVRTAAPDAAAPARQRRAAAESDLVDRRRRRR